jgi:acetamidase/formamidase
LPTHSIRPTQGSVHGPFDASRRPIVTIDSGDTVIYETLDAGWGRLAAEIGESTPDFEVSPEDQIGHALCGPIAIRGAGPGDVLEIQIGAIRPGRWGSTWAGPRPLMKHYDFCVSEETLLIWTIDPETMTATTRDVPRVSIPLRPFMGVMGNALAAPGPHSTTPPRRVGGNIDCRELVSGSTIWLPIEVEGALFSVGDGHAVQADGEVGQTAIECPMEQVELTFALRSDLDFTMPEAMTPAGYITFGFADSLHEAANVALNRMLDYMEARYRLTRARALALASLAVDVRVTQIVNTISGVHAILPHDALTINVDTAGGSSVGPPGDRVGTRRRTQS